MTSRALGPQRNDWFGPEPSRLREYGWATLIVAVTTAGGLVLRGHLKTIDVAMLYLLAVVLVSARYRQGAALLASVLSIAAFDFVFVPPYYTFGVHDSAYLLTFGVMLAVALTMSRFTAQLRVQSEEARQREQRTAAIYALNRGLADAVTVDGQVSIIERHMARVVAAQPTVILVPDEGGDSTAHWPAEGIFESCDVRVAASWAYAHGEPAGWGTNHCAEAEALVLPLRTPTRTLGIVALRPSAPETMLDGTDLRTLMALAEQVGIALEPTILSERHQQTRAEVEAERLRSSLLSSLSHDLRTPLGSIEGAASSLLQSSGSSLSPALREELAETILEESRRMSRLVGNLLDMVRVETGALAVQKAWQPLEETLGVALLRLEGRMGDHPIETHLPNDLPLVPIDELLIEQVFINLLENASKYTEPGTAIGISAWPEDSSVVVEVADGGPGIPEGSQEAVFHKFYRIRSSAAGAGGGAGLGLTICRGIIQAHGGRIWVQQREGGGASFRFTLPLVGPPLGIMPPSQEL